MEPLMRLRQILCRALVAVAVQVVDEAAPKLEEGVQSQHLLRWQSQNLLRQPRLTLGRAARLRATAALQATVPRGQTATRVERKLHPFCLNKL